VLARSLIRKHQLDLLSIPALSTGALAAIALVSLLAAKPFTLAIVRRTTPEALWSRPEFISLNRFLTSVWAASFAAAAIACALVIDLVKHDAALVSHPAFDGDFDARFSLAEGEVTEHAKSEEVFTGARLVFESGRPIAHVARDLGIESETLRKHVRQTEADEGRRKDVLSSQEREEIKSLRREVSQLRRANEILKAASVFFAGELDPHRPK
jgi:transposase